MQDLRNVKGGVILMNKKVIIASLMFALLVPLAFGQELDLGLKGGLAFPFYLGADYGDELDAKGFNTQAMVTFTGGAFLTWEIIDFLALQPEVLFTVAGSSIGTGETREVLKSYYIEIPVLLKGVFNFGDMGGISVYTGPDLLIKVTDIERFNENGDSIETFDQDIFNPLVFNMVFGIDYNVVLGPGRVFLDLRYNLGITPVYNGDQVSANAYRQNMVQVYLGYAMRLGM
jgi:hypothetical protein